MTFSSTSDASVDSDYDIDPNADRMGRAWARKQIRRVDLDMSSILSMDQKNELQELLATIVDVMEKRILNTFAGFGDQIGPAALGIHAPPIMCVTIPNPRSDKYRSSFSSKDGGTADLGPLRKSKPVMTMPKTMEEALKMTGLTEKALLARSVADMKDDVIHHFRKWKANVTVRVRDMIVKGGGTPGIPGTRQGPTPNGRGGGVYRGRNPRYGGAGSFNGSRSSSVTTPKVNSNGPSRPQHSPPVNSKDATEQALGQIAYQADNTLKDLPNQKRMIVLHSVLLMLLGLEHYASYSRALLMNLAASLDVPFHVMMSDEVRVARALSKVVAGISLEEINMRRAEEIRKTKLKSGSASKELTGVVAPALRDEGIGTVFGGSVRLNPDTVAALLGAMGENTVTVGTLFGLYGARSGGKLMDGYAKDSSDFGMLPVHAPPNTELIDPKDVPVNFRRMRFALCISGWLSGDRDNYTDTWKALAGQHELYALRYETESLSKLGDALETVTKSVAWTAARKEIAERAAAENEPPVFSSLAHSSWPVGLLRLSKLIENPWIVGMVRAEKAGLVLAEALTSKVQGDRSVTLIGYSLGARVIYNCLMHLADKKTFGIVDNVVLLGAPCPAEMRTWLTMKTVITGRLISAYSNNDYMLGFLFRSCSWTYGIAGLQKTQGVPFVENVDCSDAVTNHLQWRYMVGEVLKRVGFEDCDWSFVEREAQFRAQASEQQAQRDEQRSALSQKLESMALEEPVEPATEILLQKENILPQGNKGTKKVAQAASRKKENIR